MGDSPEEIPVFASLAADPEIAPLLDFEPVPRKREVEGGWTPELQREFIARLAFRGSAGRACDEMGKDLTGMMKLYRSPLAASFRGSWHAAIDLARRRRAEAVPEGPPPMKRPPTIDHRLKHGRFARPRTRSEWEAADGHECPHCGEGFDEELRAAREHDDSLRRVRRKLFMARRIYLLSIADDPERRAAWELLCGRADWAAARAMQAQPDEDLQRASVMELQGAGWQIPLKTGFVPDLTEPGWDPAGDPLQQLHRSIRKHDPRGSTDLGDADADIRARES